MKILYILQQSIIDNDGKWLTADSNVNMFAGLMRAWSTYEDFADYSIDVVIAPLSDFADISTYEEICPYPNVSFIQHKFYPNAMMNRFNYDANFWTSLIGNVGYDAVINCITEMSHALRVAIEMTKVDAKLVTQCFWLDAPYSGHPKADENFALAWAQMNGMLVSDLCVFTCESTKASFFANGYAMVQPWVLHEIRDKSTIWDFGYSDDEIVGKLRGRVKFGKDVARIGFLNRITKPDYTNFEVFTKALRYLELDPAYQNRFEVVATNPSKRLDEYELDSVIPNFVSYMGGKPLNRDEYIELLGSCQITVHLFEDELYGGCALRESIAAGNMIVTVDVHEQGTLVPMKSFKVERDGLTPESLAHALRVAINAATFRMPQADMEEVMKGVALMREINFNRSAFENTVVKVMDDLESLVYEETI